MRFGSPRVRRCAFALLVALAGGGVAAAVPVEVAKIVQTRVPGAWPSAAKPAGPSTARPNFVGSERHRGRPAPRLDSVPAR